MPPASPADDPVPLQRLATGSGAAVSNATPAAHAPREIVFPPRDGLAGVAAAPGTPARAGTASLQRSAAGQAATPALPGFAAAPASGASRAPSMTLHHAPAPASAYASQAASAPAPVLQRIVSEPAPAAAPAVQTSRAAGAGGLPAITATPVVQRIDGAAPEPGGAPQGHSDTELDELARALFGRIRTHLRSEVIHEREAKGLSFDAF